MGSWTEPQQPDLAQAMSDRLAASSQGVRREGTQTLVNIDPYLAKGDRDAISSSPTSHGKLLRIAERCARLGLACPKEQTVRGIVATVVALGFDSTPTPQVVVTMVHDFKRFVKDMQRGRSYNASLNHLATYPDTPNDQPRALYAHAYLDDAPLAMEVDGSAQVRASIPLRSSL